MKGIFREVKLWAMPEIVGLNRLVGRSPLLPHRSVDGAVSGEPAKSPWYRSLNGTWRFRLSPAPEEVPVGFSLPGYSVAKWSEIQVPGTWTMQGYGRPPSAEIEVPLPDFPPRLPKANPTGLYRTSFPLSSVWAKRRTILHFDGVESAFVVYVNGGEVGMSKDSRSPAEFDITPFVSVGENTLALKVVRWSDGSFVEERDEWRMGGVFRDVYLYSTASVYIHDLSLSATLADDYTTGLFSATVAIGSERELDRDLLVEVQLYGADRRPLWRNPLKGRVAADYGDSGYTVEVAREVTTPRRWSAEDPYLYWAVATLKPAKGGGAIEVVACRCGFRRVEVRERQLLVNGKRVYLRGVNRRELDAVGGKCISRETMERDARLLKGFNINAVRASHYPNHPAWYDLCDEYGIYLIDEANIQTDAKARLAADPTWLTLFLDRGSRMVLRDKNHPCVIAWSLGGPSGYGPNHEALARWIRSYDPRRPLLYEGGSGVGRSPDGRLTFGDRLSDIVAPAFPAIGSLVEWADRSGEDRPLIMSEYAPSVGNATGGLKEYWEAIESHHGLQGGFVSGWVGAELRPPDGSSSSPRGVAAGNGGKALEGPRRVEGSLIWPDRSPRPALWELKKIGEPVRVRERNLKEGRILVENRQDFTTLSWLNGSWELLVDGVVVARGALPHLETAPGASEEVTVPIGRPELLAGQECFLHVRFTTAVETIWAAVGEEVAWEQFLMPIKSPKPSLPSIEGKLTVARKGNGTLIAGGFLEVRVDRRSGRLASIKWHGHELLFSGPVMSLFRAPTDSDGPKLLPGRNGTLLDAWLAAGMDRPTLQTRRAAVKRGEGGGTVVVSLQHVASTKSLGPCFEHTHEYTIYPGGEIHVVNTFTADKRLPELPRVGVVLSVMKGLEHVRWLGRGPHESYADRKCGAAVGLYEGSVAEQFVPYVVPQENGNKTDVRWLSLEDERGVGILFAADGVMECGVSHYSTLDLFKAREIRELKPSPDVFVYLDLHQRGVGPASDEQSALERFRITPGSFRFAYWIRGFVRGEEDPGLLARHIAQG